MAESAWVIRESGLETGPNKRERGESQREAPNEFQDSTGRQGREREREIVRTLLRMHVRTNVRKVTLFSLSGLWRIPFSQWRGKP